MELKIDEDFKSLLPPLGFEERNQLEENLLNEGCRDAIVVWDDIILDGHNRYSICQQHDIDFDVVRLDFENRHEAIVWIIDNQHGRRNLSDVVIAYQMGRKYEEQKLAIGDNQYTTDRVPQNEAATERTSEIIADEYDVSHATVERNAQFANAVDKIVEDTGIDRQEILEIRGPKTKFQELSQMEPEIQTEIIETAIEKNLPLKIPEPEFKLPDDYVDRDYCACEIYIPKRSEVTTCPCGCGYGYCEVTEQWFTPDEIEELEV